MKTSVKLFVAIGFALPTLGSAQEYPYASAPYPAPYYVAPRVNWRRPIVVTAPVYYPPAPVYVAPPPPPPVYIAPPPPVYYAPPPPVYYAPPPPVYVAPAPVATVVAAKPLPDYEHRVGLGATAEGLFTVQDGTNQGYGLLGQLRYRNSRHLAIELMGGYEKSTDRANFARTDVPITFGLVIPFLGPERALSPYIVGAGGLNFADLQLIDNKIEDKRTQVIGQIGGGLEIRLGERLALNGDLRLEGRWNTNQASEAVQNTHSIDGKTVTPIADNVSVRAGVGATVYF